MEISVNKYRRGQYKLPIFFITRLNTQCKHSITIHYLLMGPVLTGGIIDLHLLYLQLMSSFGNDGNSLKAVYFAPGDSPAKAFV